MLQPDDASCALGVGTTDETGAQQQQQQQQQRRRQQKAQDKGTMHVLMPLSAWGTILPVLLPLDASMGSSCATPTCVCARSAKSLWIKSSACQCAG